MTNAIVGYFEDYDEARRAEQDLLNSGFRGQVQVVTQDADGMQLTQGTQEESWWERAKAALGFASEHELKDYREATRRGGTLVTVRAPEEQSTVVVEILERHHPVDLDQRVQSWYGEGTQTLTGVGGRPASATERESEVSIPLAEEQLKVGKRAVQRGALRIHTYVTEQPVEEQVTLREETVSVDRRPVDRPAVAGEAAFQERTLEVAEMGEEAVVSKEARVVEEVAVAKEQKARTETVRDTVRKTQVATDREGRKNKP